MLKAKYPNLASEFVALRSYCRWLPELNRRETWEEVVERVTLFLHAEAPHSSKIPSKVWTSIKEGMLSFEIMPSMRLAATAGPAAKRDNLTGFNCAYLPIDSLKSFSELMYILMCGTGAGFSVEKENVLKLPTIKYTTSIRRDDYVIEDSREGWAKAFQFGLEAWYEGEDVIFDYTGIRPYGAPLKTMGGRACLTGDTIVYKDRKKSRGYNEITIKELYDMKITNLRNGAPAHFEDIKLRSLDEESGEFFRNAIVNIADNGISPVYSIITENGYRIKATDNHRFLKEDGDYDYVSNFSVGDLIAVNGSPEKKSGICIDCGKAISRRAIRCRDCCIITQMNPTCSENTSRGRKECQSQKKSMCEICDHDGSISELHVHHIDVNPMNNAISNLQTLCEKCHKIVHAKISTYGNPYSHKYLSFDKIISIEYVGSERVYDIEMLTPNHNFIANGFVSHNSGPGPLTELLEFSRDIIQAAAGRQLRPIEVHDICCKTAEVVVAGGTRRSACISFSDLEDEEMREAKKMPFPAHRYMANNSVVFKSKPDTVTFLKEWSALAESGTGERGILNVSNLSSICKDRKFSADMRTNPCVTGDTWVLTTDGSRQVKDLIATPFTAIVNGELNRSERGFWSTGIKKVFEVQTSKGFKIRLTDNHKLLRFNYAEAPDTWTEVKNLKVNETICLSNHLNQSATYYSNNDETEKGWLLGSLVGDGTFTDKIACLDFWGETAPELANYALELIDKHLVHRSDLGVTNQVQEGKLRVGCVGLKDLAQKYDIVQGNKYITDKVEGGSRSFKVGFLRGIFDADGSVQGTQSKGVSIRLNQSNLPLLESAQRMLSSLGILSTIYPNRKLACWKLMPDGKGGSQPYYCKDNHELVIANQNIINYSNLIGFEDNNKQTKLLALISNYKRTPNYQSFIDTIVSISEVGSEEVYDCTIEGAHEFCANGIRSHNCGEIILRPYGLCNLSEVVIREDDDLDDLMEKVKTATWLGVIQSTFTYFPFLRPIWKKNAEEERLIGVSLTGQLDNQKILTDEVLRQLKKLAIKTAKHAAELLNINTPKAFTCTKPSGTVSQVVDSASGCHPRYSKYYIRRYRISKADPLFKLMVEQGISFKPENNQTEDNFTTAVVEFPIKSPDKAIIRDQWDAMKQLEWYLHVQKNWSTHNVSNTVYVKANEWLKVGNWVYEHFEDIVGVSFLPYDDHGYQLAPYEEIDEEEYERLLSIFPKLDFSKLGYIEKDTGDTTEVSKAYACTGDKCELR